MPHRSNSASFRRAKAREKARLDLVRMNAILASARMMDGRDEETPPVTGRGFAVFVQPRTTGLPQWVADAVGPETATNLQRVRTALVVHNLVGSFSQSDGTFGGIFQFWQPDAITLSGKNTTTVIEVGARGLRTWQHLVPSCVRTDGAARTVSVPTEAVLGHLTGRAEKSGVSRNQAVRAAVSSFIRSLDPDILTTLRRARLLTEAAYNWVMIDRERRAAAIRSYPALAHQMIGNSDVEISIAFGGSLEDALCHGRGEGTPSRAVVRALANRPAAAVLMAAALSSPLTRVRRQQAEAADRHDDALALRVIDAAHTSYSTLRWLEHTPADLLPRSPVAWHEWGWSVDAAQCLAISGFRNADDSDALSAFFSDTLRGFVSRRAGVDDLLSRKRRFNTAAIFDAVHDLFENVLVPAAVLSDRMPTSSLLYCFEDDRVPYRYHDTSSNRSSLMRLLAGRGGMHTLQAISETWHETVRRQGGVAKGGASLLKTDSPVAVLEPRTSELRLKNGDVVRVTPLRTVGEVRNEGEHMGHCLGTIYLERVVLGEVFAYGLDGVRPDGSTYHLTATVQPDTQDDFDCDFDFDRRRRRQRTEKKSADGIPRYRLHEMKGYRNSSPDLIAGNGVQALLNKALVASVEGVVPAIDENFRKRILARRSYLGMKQAPEYATEIMTLAFNRWKPALPKRLRAAGPQELLFGPFSPVASLLLMPVESQSQIEAKIRERVARMSDMAEMSDIYMNAIVEPTGARAPEPEKEHEIAEDGVSGRDNGLLSALTQRIQQMYGRWAA